MNIGSLGITVFSTLILVACGGSSESENASAENRSDQIPEQSIISNLEWSEYSFDHASPTTLNIIKKSLMTINSRSLYRKFEYTTVGTVPENYPWLFETEALTEDGLYQLPETASQQGYHYGVDLNISVNGTVWTFTPYSNLHLKRLKFTTDYDVINLSVIILIHIYILGKVIYSHLATPLLPAI